MGSEFGQVRKWSHEESLQWHVLQYYPHSGMQKWVKDLNRAYKENPPFFESDSGWEGFEWIDANDSDNSVLSFIRKSPSSQETVLCVFNFTPVPRHNYKVGVDCKGVWEEILNSDGIEYFGNGLGNMGFKETIDWGSHARPYSLDITIPPLGAVFFRYGRK